jgi:hypothetical protein
MDNAQDLRPGPKKRPKTRTIVIGIVLALIVTLSGVAVFLLNEAHERDTYNQHTGPSQTISRIPGGLKITIHAMSEDTPWTDVTILLTDGSNAAMWSPLTTDLDNGTAARWNKIALAANMGTLNVNISITDLAGNGRLDQGDYFNLTVGTGQTFASATTYTMTMMHDPTASAIFHNDFTG